jgi:molecular chaperone DnaK
MELSTTMETEVNLPFITADASGPRHLLIKVTRSKLEQLMGPLIQRTVDPLKHAIEDAGLKPADIDEVILVGGSTRIPMVQETVKEFFGKEPHKGVNPDEVVAAGAAIQGAVLAGDVKDVLLLDVTPLTLGIETLGGVFTKMIPRNTTIPTKKMEIFSTASDNQPSVEVHVLQGEREMASTNRTLGRFHLDGIPPAPRGIPKIEVAFDINADGILHVSARDTGTGKEQAITITGHSGLDDGEIDRMVQDADVHQEEDKKRREIIDTKNHADTLVYTLEKTLRENKDKIDPKEASQLQMEIDNTKSAIATDNLDQIKKAVESLTQASHKLSQMMYQQAGAQQAPGAEGSPDGTTPPPADESTEDEVIDAEVVEEETEKKTK